jgi:predicted phosphodiesterase
MILMLGDIHGNFNYIKTLLKGKSITDCTIIQVGDFGIGFTDDVNDKRILEEFNNFLNEKNIMMYAIRGNHDNPDCFDGTWKWGNLHLIPDYTVLNLEGYNILCIGGAISIDRQPRIVENMSAARYGSRKRYYWYDEKVIFNEEFLTNVRDIDILVTHTAPDFCVPSNKLGYGSLVEEFASYDKTLKDELKEERDLMTEIWDILNENNKIQKHYYGHFHRSHVDKIVDCEHILLNINELKELR